jgi:uncharacterized protein (TIGR02246 family)
MDRDRVAAWVAAYERAWRTPGTESLAEIFREDATYLQGPYEDLISGLIAIRRMWAAERDGPDEVFKMTSHIVAVEDDTAVVRVNVFYGDPLAQEYRDLWIMRFAADGRCRAFEEWPFWPEQRSGTVHRDAGGGEAPR